MHESRLFEKSLRELMETMGGAALYLDSELNIKFSSRAANKLFGLHARGPAPLENAAPLVEFDRRIVDDARKTLLASKPLERSVKLHEHAYKRRTIPFGQTDSAVNGLVVVYTPINQESRTMASALKEQVRLASTARFRMFSAASHNLRQPLQSLVLLHSLLVKTVEDEKAQRLLARSGEILNSMTSMINALLEMNKAEDEDGDLEQHIVVFPVIDILHKLENEFAPQARLAGMDFRVVPCRYFVESDPILLEQMVRNLVANALTYTNKGKALLGCRKRGQTLTIEIWDTGVGITPAEFEAIFDEFPQLDTSGSASPAKESASGLGVGLSIVKRLARRLGHKVGVRSSPGNGAAFSIEIKLAAATDLALQGKDQSESSRHRLQPASGEANKTGEPKGADEPLVFVVDDDKRIRDALRSVLEDDGYLVEDFESCQDFLRAYRPGREACLLIDAYLPRMNGLELLKRLRADGEYPPAVMITGTADVSTAVQAMKAGALDFIEKPIGRTELLSCVEQALNQARDSTTLNARREAAATQLSELTPRQRQIMDLVLAGEPSKNIAADLGISQRTVENHRASIMKRTGSRSLPELARLALTAAFDGGERDSRK